MQAAKRRTAFVLSASDQGTFIVNRLDHVWNRIGVGFQLLEKTSYDRDEVDGGLTLLELRRQIAGDGVMAIDCGANIGVHTVAWARGMTGWGSIVAIEAQERIFYALAGNVALNNCFNASVIWAAVSATNGTMRVPRVNYLEPASFGSLELMPRPETEFIGQPIDYSDAALTEVRTIALDSLPLDRIDLIKLDVEGMEMMVLNGARRVLARHRPIVLAETIKSDGAALQELFASHGYRSWLLGGVSMLAVHESDETARRLHEIPLFAQVGKPIESPSLSPSRD